MEKLHEDLAKDMGRRVVISGKSKVAKLEIDEDEDVEDYNDDDDDEEEES